MLKADEEYYAKNGEPLFSSHMLDLSEEKDGENIATCVKVRGKRGVCRIKIFCVISNAPVESPRPQCFETLAFFIIRYNYV